MQMSTWETKKMRTLRSRNSQSQSASNESNEQRVIRISKIQDMLSTGVGVLLVSEVEVLVDNIDLNCWKKRNERGRLRFKLSITVFFFIE